MLPFIRYRPDLAALRAKVPGLVLGVGQYRAEVATRIALTLADRLGIQATRFPGTTPGTCGARRSSPRDSARI